MISVLVSLALLANVVSSPAAREQIQIRKQEAVQNTQLKREEYRHRLAEIKDERRQRIVENLDQRIIQVNDKWVGHWNNVLSRLETILAKIKQESPGADIAAAQAAIVKAQEAVDSQADKVYSIEIVDDENLGQNVRSTISELHADLREVRALVKAARDEVVDIIRLSDEK